MSCSGRGKPRGRGLPVAATRRFGGVGAPKTRARTPGAVRVSSTAQLLPRKGVSSSSLSAASPPPVRGFYPSLELLRLRRVHPPRGAGAAVRADAAASARAWGLDPAPLPADAPAPGTPRPPARPRAPAGGAFGGSEAGRGAGARPGVAASAAARRASQPGPACQRHLLAAAAPARAPRLLGDRRLHAPAGRRAPQQHALFPDGDHGRDGDAGVLLRVHGHVRRERAGLLLPRQRLPQALPGPGGQQRRAARAPLLPGRRGSRARGKPRARPRPPPSSRVEAPPRLGRPSLGPVSSSNSRAAPSPADIC